jgi:hypothetical protein
MVKLKPKQGHQTAYRVVIGANVFKPDTVIEERFIPLVKDHFELEAMIEIPERKPRRQPQEVNDANKDN